MPGPRPKAKKLSGLNPLAYVGVEPTTPLQFTINDRAPTANDYANHNVGEMWLHKLASPTIETIDELWILVNKNNNVATWVQFGSDDVATQFDTDSGSAVPVLGILEILGGTNANTAGSGNTVTVNATTATDVATSYTTDAGSAVPAANVLTVAGGTGIDTSGAGSTVTIDTSSDVATTYDADTGSATPAANVITIAGGTNVTTSAAGSTVTITATDTTGLTTAGDNLNESPAGTVNLNETIHWPNTNAAGTTGVIYLGGSGGTGGTRFLHNYGGTESTFVGERAGNFTSTGTTNTGFGEGVLDDLTSGSNNTGCGQGSLADCTAGNANAGLGNGACFRITTGSSNTALGTAALDHVTTGDSNIGVGNGAGAQYTLGDSSNIAIGHIGLTAENNTIRLGTAGAGAAQQNKCFIAGIRGITTGVADAVAVLIDSAYQLGTVSSTIRVKQNVKTMTTEGDDILKLRPVTFEYKERPGIKQYGLIAEEVNEVLPRLVVNDEEGEPLTIQYHVIPSLLIHTIQKLEKRIAELEKKLLS